MSGSWGKKDGGAVRSDYVLQDMNRRRARMWKDFANSDKSTWDAEACAAAMTWAGASRFAMIHFPEGSGRKLLCGGDGDQPGAALSFARCCLTESGQQPRQHTDVGVFAAIQHRLSPEDVKIFARGVAQRTKKPTNGVNA